MKKKFLTYFLSILLGFIILTIFIISQNTWGFKDSTKKFLLNKYPNLELRTNLFKEKSIIKNLNNDYNIKFLPETQFLNLNLNKKKIIFNPNYKNKHAKSKWMYNSFYLDEYREKIILVNYLGEIYHFNKNKLSNKKTASIKPESIPSNLSSYKVLDIKVYNKKIYVSHIQENKDCDNLNISVADLNFNFLNFDPFFISKECGSYIQGGRIVAYRHNDIDGLLFSTSDQMPDNTDGELPPPQDNNSEFGKILFFNTDTKEYIHFSKGHRNIQGLYAEDNLILSTEHGPRGGDEINKILFKKNYGWPIASYGEKYALDNSKTYYKKNHFSFGFEEPIFAFIPSLGISEIIRLPNSFSENFKDNFIISTLAQLHLHRVRFNSSFDKLIFHEEIYIGDRMRDIRYIKDHDLILMALEKKGELGILTNSQK
jgi:hypothetical protein